MAPYSDNNPAAIVAVLAQAGAGLTLTHDGGLKVTPKGVLQTLPAPLREAIRTHRAALIAALERQAAPDVPGGATVDDTTRQAWGVFDEVLYRHQEGQTTGALGVPKEVVAYLWEIKQTMPDELTRALRLTSRDGTGNDTATACLLAVHATLCARLMATGVDTLYYRAPMRLLTWHMRTGAPLGPALARGERWAMAS